MTYRTFVLVAFLSTTLTGTAQALTAGGSAPSVPRAAPVQLAQAVDPRITRLEEQIRELNGLVEELNFQVLQMQDQIQRMREDNEFRFQQLEGGSSTGTGTTGADDSRTQAAPPAVDSTDVTALPPAGEGSSAQNAAPPRDFGTIVFDADGNVRSATGEILPQTTLPTADDVQSSALPGVSTPGLPAPQAGGDDTVVAALPDAGNPDELYRNSYEFILAGDYAMAETGFRDLIKQYPQSEMAPEAHFWLGEALLAQDRPREAAEIFLSASRDFPDSRRAPETLYKLGVSLAQIDQRDVACATFAEVGRRYPNASGTLMDKVEQQQASASC